MLQVDNALSCNVSLVNFMSAECCFKGEITYESLIDEIIKL